MENIKIFEYCKNFFWNFYLNMYKEYTLFSVKSNEIKKAKNHKKCSVKTKKSHRESNHKY